MTAPDTLEKPSTTTTADDMALEDRFGFGANWARFLSVLDDSRIAEAEASLKAMLGVETLEGKTFLDIGSGSGLFSLSARRLGATVRSFDFDPNSVNCTAELKRRYFADEDRWTVGRGSVLDGAFVEGLGTFDVVYSWGVLHHTGHMWTALANAAGRVADGGTLFIAIYNDQGGTSRRWTWVKRNYVRGGKVVRALLVAGSFVRIWGTTILRDTLKGDPTRSWRNYAKLPGMRGMNPWYDLIDWVGGFPFEVAKPEEMFDFHRDRGFRMTKMRTCGGGLGCNEFVFVKDGAATTPAS